ncbi:hypothetical protein VOLCADRAFT_119548, partial [Volvox carteri f. nagariensis]
IDSAFASTLRLSSSGDKLKALARNLTDTGLVNFCCVYLVHPARGTFGIAALSGAGSELYPPMLTGKEAQRAVGLSDFGSPSPLNVFTRCVFQVRDCNWCVEDVVGSKAPWYYDCASAANGFGLPQDGGWLRCAGMRSVLALPCMQGADVTGVLTVASKQKSLDHLLLRKLEELCFKITPVVTDAVLEFSSLLCNRQAASRYESVSDFAHEVLGELLNLDRAVAASIVCRSTAEGGAVHRGSASASKQQQQQQQRRPLAAAAAAEGLGQGQQSGARGACRKAAEERSVFDAAAAVAAAAAAGFSWTVPTAAAAAEPVTPTLRHVTNQQQQQQQLDCPSAHSFLLTDTFCTAMTDIAPYAVVLTSDLAVSVPEVPEVSSAAAASTSAVPSASARPTPPPSHSALVMPDNGWIRVPYVSTSRSLPDRSPPAAAVDYLRGVEAAPPPPPRHHPHHHYHHHHQQQQVQQPVSGATTATAAAAAAAVPASDRNASRSTRSLSCLEFSGGVSEAAGREESTTDSVSGGMMLQSKAATAGPAAAAAATTESAVKVAAVEASLALSRARSPAHSMVVESNRSSESGCAEVPYMIESRSTEDLAAALRCDGNGGGGNVENVQKAPAFHNSSKNMESRIMLRGAPLERSVGASGGGGGAAAAAHVGRTSQEPSDEAAAAASLMMAHGSSCGTDYSNMMAVDAMLRYTNSSRNTNTCIYGGGSSTARLSGAWGSQCAGGSAVGGDLSEVRTSLRGGGARGRWSRDSAAAAAAVWSNEAAEAFAAALRFTRTHGAPTASRCSGGGASASAAEPPSWRAQAGGAVANGRTMLTPGLRYGSCASTAPALGDLYGINESGPVPALQWSLEFSDDGSVAVVDIPSPRGGSSGDVNGINTGGGGGGAFVVSSGLGAEALRLYGERYAGCSSGSDAVPVCGAPTVTARHALLAVRNTGARPPPIEWGGRGPRCPSCAGARRAPQSPVLQVDGTACGLSRPPAGLPGPRARGLDCGLWDPQSSPCTFHIGQRREADPVPYALLHPCWCFYALHAAPLWFRGGPAVDQAEGADKALPAMVRYFAYMPYMHAEDLEAQERGVQLFRVAAETTEAAGPAAAAAAKALRNALSYMEAHRNVVAAWGRFPHRNTVLGRTSTAEELAGLADGSIAKF